jgi:hypothetical protein
MAVIPSRLRLAVEGPGRDVRMPRALSARQINARLSRILFNSHLPRP